MSKPAIVLYHYDASPFATKVKNMLVLKRIPHKRVEVSMILPRPELSELLGVTYRRIPILAIGNDVYCDTSLIASALERRFPPSEGYGTLFPPRKGGGKADTGLVKAVSVYWSDKVVFPLAAQSLPYDRFDAKFLADRSAWMGAKIDAKALSARQASRTSAISSHLMLLEEELADGREWVLDTEGPSLADVSAHFVFSWMRVFKNVKEIFDATVFPKSIAWLDRVSEYLARSQKQNVAAFETLTGKDAAHLIRSSPHEDDASVGFESVDASRLGLKSGELVSVVPTDNGKVPTEGRLLALSRLEVVIETKGSAGTVRCHFPRLEFMIQPSTQEGAKL